MRRDENEQCQEFVWKVVLFIARLFLYVAYALYIEFLNNDTVEIYINAHF